MGKPSQEFNTNTRGLQHLAVLLIKAAYRTPGRRWGTGAVGPVPNEKREL